jgi:excisionase family DNA binding protein
MIKLVLSALQKDEPNLPLAIGGLLELVGSSADNQESSTYLANHAINGPAPVRGVSISEAARQLSYCAQTIRAMIKRGELRTVGSGRSTRVLLEEALKPIPADTFESDEPAPDSFDAAAKDWLRERRERSVQ